MYQKNSIGFKKSCVLLTLCSMLLAFFAALTFAADKLQVIDGTIKVTSDGPKFSLFENDVSENQAWFYLINATGAPGVFIPLLYMGSNNTSSAYANAIVANVTQDEVGMGPVFSFMARANNGLVLNRDLFWFDNYAGNPVMVIRANGRIGIGTTVPAGTLDVNGSIYQRGGQLYADYVFSKDYKLESIEDHAKYMWENMHLKAVPIVKKDEHGQEIIEVGSHQRSMLEELEKAHIYIEQLNKKINALESKFKALEVNK